MFYSEKPHPTEFVPVGFFQYILAKEEDTMNIPADFKRKMMTVFGEEGEKWLSFLPALVKRYTEKWQLNIEGPVDNLSYNYVVKARDSEQRPLILKFGIPGLDVTREIHAVEIYGGERFAKLVAFDEADGALLLERLEPGNMLSEVKDEEAVILQYIDVWKAIRKPANPSFLSIYQWFNGLDEYTKRYPKEDGPISGKLVAQARHYVKEIQTTSAGDELLHGDLHHYNILYDQKCGWCAIDPKGIVGDVYFDFVPFLFNELRSQSILKQRVESICILLRINKKRLLKASIALLILQTCWAVEDEGNWRGMLTTIQWLEDLLNE